MIHNGEFLKEHGITAYDIEREIQYMEMNNKMEVHNNNAFEGYSIENLKELLKTY